MNPKHLVLTALIENEVNNQIKIKNTDVIYLGQWCFNSVEDFETTRSVSILPYHWNDRAKLKKDYLFLQEVYEEFLQLLSVNLNQIHGVKFSLRYWRIVIGPWLNYFIPIIFDRFSMLEIAFSNYSISSFTTFDTSIDYELLDDMDSFIKKIGDDTFNQFIYQDLIYKFYKDEHKLERFKLKHNYSVVKAPKPLLKNMIKHILTKISSLFSQPEEPFFLPTNFGWFRLFSLQFHLKVFPRFWFKKQLKPDKYLYIDRSEILRNSKDHSKFYKILRYMIQRHLPKSYIENYQGLRSQTKNLGWPEKPISIFTCDAYGHDDLFKLWAAEKVERGSKLLIGQHGGNYGIDLFNAEEEHVISISDKFLTWGWNKRPDKFVSPEDNTISSFGIFTRLTNKVQYKADGNLLFVSTNILRYSYRMFSIPISSQWLSYFEDQISFMKSLSNKVFDKTILRHFKEDYGRNERTRWLENFPNLKIDDGVRDIVHLYSKSRLVVHSYNATSFLETLYLNIPTVIFWDMQLWEIRPESLIYFEEISNVGIFHETPESASNHINTIWGDVEKWWYSTEVQKARKTFCEQYAKENSSFEVELAQILKQT